MEPNYTTTDIEARAVAAREAHRDYIADLETKYHQRCDWRKERKILPIGVCGYGRAGKDTAAEYLCAHTDMQYPMSASWVVLPMIAHMIGIPKEEAWKVRHDHREFWIAACHAVRGRDYGFLVRMCLGAGDIAVGIRGRLELDEVARTGVVGMTLWIDNPRVKPDITVEYGPDDCDIMVPNHGSRLDLYARLHKLLRLLHSGAFTKIY